MNKFFRKQYVNLLQSQVKKAEIVPVQNPDNEDQRLLELKRLGVPECLDNISLPPPSSSRISSGSP